MLFDLLSEWANNLTQDLKGRLNAIVLSLHGTNLHHVLNSKYYFLSYKLSQPQGWKRPKLESREKEKLFSKIRRASWAAQWQRIYLLMQEPWAPSLVRKDPA